MRADQYTKLQALHEKLMDLFLVEADPAEWPGAGIAQTAMDKSTRGDRFWAKRNAAATLSIITRGSQLIHDIQQRSAGAKNGTGAVEDPDTGDDEIEAYEAEASKLLSKLTDKASRVARPPKKADGKSA